MILSPEVLTLLILNILFFIFATIAFYMSLKIYLKWNSDANTPTQYKLEKSSYLSATIIKYIFAIKVPLFLFFIFTLDKISNVIHGAMCGAGVVDATPYGTYLLILKVLNLYLFAYWIVFHKHDIQYEEQPYIKQKFGIFLILYILLVIEIVLEFVMFNAIDVSSVVDCCGVIYSGSSISYLSLLLNMKPLYLLLLFYFSFVALGITYYLKNRYLFSLANTFFIILSLVTLIVFFGTYIYELPTHRCPFCFLQKDYNYIGYLLYAFLFLGTFNGLVVAFINFSKKELEKFYKLSLFFNSVYVLIVSYYPIMFYIRNGVWL